MPAESAALLRSAADTLRRAGVPSPRRDAAELLAHVLGLPVGRLVLHDGPLPAPVPERLGELVARRAGREPLQHLTGRAGFRRLDLAVGPGVFIPRPETEPMVDWCLAVLADRAAPVAVDLCAGSGAIALALADEHPSVVVHAVEREPAAYAWLARNCAGSPRVRPRHADAALVPAGLAGSADLVVANPPYLPDGGPVAPEVRHDPAAALWGGVDGLDGLRLVERAAREWLAAGGRVAVEHADGAGPAAAGALEAAGWQQVGQHRDLTGRPRFVTARWSP